MNYTNSFTASKQKEEQLERELNAKQSYVFELEDEIKGMKREIDTKERELENLDRIRNRLSNLESQL